MTLSFKSASILLVSLAVASAAQAGTRYYSVNGGGAEAQVGAGLPLPIQDQFSVMGGKDGMGGAIGSFTNFPPLLIPVNPNDSQALIKQTTTMTMQPRMTIAPGVFRRIPTKNGTTMGTPVPLCIGVAKNNARVLAVRTTLSFSAPAHLLTTPMGAKGTVVFKTGQRANANATYNGTPVGSKVVYKSKGARFGGAAQTRIRNLGIQPVPNPLGEGLPAIWADEADNLKASVSCKHPKFGGSDAFCFATKAPVYVPPLLAAGGPKSNVVSTPGPPPPKPGKVALSLIGPVDCQFKSTPLSPTGNTNMATSVGFPWTTGAITISQPAAIPGPEKFHITGMDGRVNGVGTIRLVSSALSKRLASGPSATRAWAEYQVPEPGAVLGAASALAALGICHRLARRRR